MPRINLLVDIYNLVSVKTRLALGAHDLSHVRGGVHLRRTTGRERFLPLGASEPKPVRTGAYAYVDDSDEVLCWLEVRQVETTKVTLESRDCFYIIQGNSRVPQEALRSAAEELITLTKRFCGGEARLLHESSI